jgi:hypothetical protein
MATHFPSPADGTGPVDIGSCRIVETSANPLLDAVFVHNGGADNAHVDYKPRARSVRRSSWWSRTPGGVERGPASWLAATFANTYLPPGRADDRWIDRTTGD